MPARRRRSDCRARCAARCTRARRAASRSRHRRVARRRARRGSAGSPRGRLLVRLSRRRPRPRRSRRVRASVAHRPEPSTGRHPERGDAEREPSGRSNDPARTSPRAPAASATTKSDGAGTSRRRATIAAAASARLIAASAARSWWPRNEGCRQPAFQAPKMSTRRTGGARRPLRRPPRPRFRRARPPGHRSPHEQRHREGEEPVLHELEEAHQVVGEERVVEYTGLNVWNASHASSGAPGSRDVRPAASRRAPLRDAAAAAATRTTRRRDRTAGCRLSSTRGRRRVRAGSARGRTGTAATAASTRAPSASRSTRLRRPDDDRVLSNAPVVTAPLWGTPHRIRPALASFATARPRLHADVLPGAPTPVGDGCVDLRRRGLRHRRDDRRSAGPRP